MKATEQYFPVVLFIMLCKVVLTFESVDEILKCDHSKKLLNTLLLFLLVFQLFTKQYYSGLVSYYEELTFFILFSFLGVTDFVITFTDENSAHLVELYLDVDITKFTEESKVIKKKA